jgi:hypothetical protein
VIFLIQTKGATFWIDEWRWVTLRHGGGLDTFLQPHNQHFSLVPVIIYKLLFATAGLDDYAAYRVVVTLGQLAFVALLFEYVRRRVGPVLALAAAAVILFLGPGWQVFLWPFQIAWLISLGAGVGALLMLDREDKVGDVGACALVTVSLASSGLGIAVAVGVVVEALARRRLRRRLWIVAIPICLYFAWWLAYDPKSNVTAEALEKTPLFVARSVAAAVSGLVGLGDFAVPATTRTTTVMWVLAAAALMALAFRLVRLGRVPVRVVTLLTTVVSFWVLTGLSRASAVAPSASRYVYVGAVLVLLIAVELARGVRIPRWATAAVAAVALGSVILNFSFLEQGSWTLRNAGANDRALLGALEIARPYVPPGHVIRLLESFIPVRPRDYFAARDSRGSPAMTPSEIATAPEYARQTADFELASAYGVRARPAPEGSRPDSRPPVLASQFGGTVVRRRRCLVLRARSKRQPGLAGLPVPPSGLLLDTEARRATVVLRRFADTFPTPALTRQLAQEATQPGLRNPAIIPLAAGRRQVIRIPRDRAPQFWRAQVRATQGRVTICRLRLPPA